MFPQSSIVLKSLFRVQVAYSLLAIGLVYGMPWVLRLCNLKPWQMLACTSGVFVGIGFALTLLRGRGIFERHARGLVLGITLCLVATGMALSHFFVLALILGGVALLLPCLSQVEYGSYTAGTKYMLSAPLSFAGFCSVYAATYVLLGERGGPILALFGFPLTLSFFIGMWQFDCVYHHNEETAHT